MGGLVIKNLLAKKPMEQLASEGERSDLKRSLGVFDLIALGIGAIIGGGIFVLTGVAAKQVGPAVSLSFALAGLVSMFSALCYAELAAMIPVSGSAYTYAYAGLGEIVAWVIGWDLILEYSISAAAVANGWSAYVSDALRQMGMDLPTWMTGGPWSTPGGVVDLPALLIVAILASLMITGIREGARLNRVMVSLKITVVLFVILLGAFFVKPVNWHPFMPFGAHSIVAGAAIVFFAFLGFDALSTTAEEAKNPQRDLPAGILGSLVVCSALYIMVTLVLTGMVPFTQIDERAPVSEAFQFAGIHWAAGIISAGAIAGLTSVLAVILLAQPRILFNMSRDGLLPEWASKVHPRFKTPHVTTLLGGLFIGLIAMFLPIEKLVELANTGTLFAFAVVCSSVLVLRSTNPGARRPFRIPGGPLIPICGLVSCVWMIFNLPPLSWLSFGVWLSVGAAIYFSYGMRHSKARAGNS